MNKAKIFLTFFLWFCMICIAMGQSSPKHNHRPGEKCLDCRASEVNEVAAREEAEYLKTRPLKSRAKSVRVTTPPDDFEYVIPVVFHVFGAEYDNGAKITVDLIRNALVETNKDYWGLQADWQQLHPERDPFKCPLKITFRLAEKDPDGNPTTGVTFHDWNSGFGNGGGYDAEIQKYAWDNYRYMNVYIMQDLYNDGATNNSGVAWYPSVRMSDANLARVVYNGSYIGTNTDSEFRSVLTHEFGHFFNLMHTFEGCENGEYTYPNDEIDDTPVHLKNSNLREGDKNPFGEVIDVCNFMNYPREYKNFTKGQVARMKEALMHEARVTLWQEENHKKVFYTEPTPRIEVAENTIREAAANDGSFTAVYKILLRDCNLKVAEGEYLAATDYTVKDLPEGVTLKLKAAPENYLEGELTGKFAAHAAANNGSFSVTLKNSMLTEGTILNPTFTLNYTFRDTYTIIYGDAGNISISPANTWKFFSLGAGNAEYGAWYSNNSDIVDAYKLQSYKKPLVIYPGTLNIKPLILGEVIDENASWGTPADEYAGVFDLKSPDYNEWVGQNAYVGIQFVANGETLYGWMNISFNADGKGYTIHDWAYNTEPGGAIKAGETADGIQEKVQVSPSEVVEDVVNDGTVNEKVSLKISGVTSEFTKSGLLVAGTDYTITGIPEGLAVKISLTDKTNGVIDISGKAVQHSEADGKTIKIDLNKALVSNAKIGGLSQKIKIVFKNPYDIFYNDMDDLWCAPSGSWGEFSFGIGNADYEVWYAEKLGGKYKLVSANNPLIVHKGTSNIVALEFGQTIGETLMEGMEWKQQKTGVPQPEIDESMLDVKSDTYLDWVGKTAYVGIQFVNDGLLHYGWIGIRFEADGNMMTVEDWAYNEAPGEPIQAGYKKKDQKPYLAWTTTELYEPVINDGSLDSVSVSVKGAEFAVAAGEKLTAGTHYTADGLPAGLSVAVQVIDKVTAQIQLIGKAQNHAAADSIKDWNIAFKDAAFTKPVEEKEHKFNIYFRDPFGIVYVDIEDVICNASNTFTHIFPVAGHKEIDFAVWFDDEGALRLEAYKQNIICTNAGESTAFVKPLDKGYLIANEDLWNIGGDWPNEHWIFGPNYTDWAGKEAYLGFAFQLEGNFHFGWMRLEVTADGSSYTVKDLAYHSGPMTPVRAGDNGTLEPPFLVAKNTTFHEGINNDGAVTDSVVIDLVFGKFAKASGVLQAGTDYTFDGLGEGLTLVAELRGDEKVVLKVNGKAAAHDKAASVKNLKFSFKDAAFVAGTNLAKKDVRLAFEFLDPYKVVYVDIPNFECSRYNTWTILDIDGNAYGVWYDINDRLSLRLETYGAPLICEGTSRNIAPVKAGEIIGGASNWVDGGDWPDEHFIHHPDYTVWRDKEAYIGIKYDFQGHTRYGWIRIEVAADGQSYIVKDYAYNEMFDEPIMAGAQTQQNLMVSFAADKTLTYEGFDIDFTNYSYSALPVESYKWTFEGGTPAVFEGEKPGKITYHTAGSYAVGLEVKTADTTITLTRKDYITIEPVMLKADYTVSASSLVEGGKVMFTDASTGSFDVAKWEWTFEGGQPASFEGQHPGEVTYATAGDYEVILKVTDEKGRVHTRFATPGVTVFPADYRDYCQVSVTPPTENTYCYIKNVIFGEQNNASESGNYTDYSRTVQFAAQKGEVLPFDVDLNTNNQEARVMAWIDWNGNGTFEDAEVVASYISNYDKPEHLTVTVPEDAAEGIVGMRVRVKIGDKVLKPCEDEGYYGEVEDYSLVISQPAKSGDILADKQNIKNGEYVTFRANINEITEAGVESYKWIFEGATPATSGERVPAPVQYTEVGVHPVVLELTLQGGEKKIVEKKNFIVVNPATTLARFEASSTDIVKGGSVNFIDRSESSAGIAAWEWSFEGGMPATFSGQTPPDVFYNQAGLYEVVLKITDVNGATHTLIQPMLINVYENTNTYCQIADKGSYYSIINVAVGDQKHETTHAPEKWVNDYTDFAFVLSKDSALPFVVDLSMDGTPAKVMAWVDWNQDGTFDEATETIARYQDDAKPAEIMITVPADAKEGATRMRVRTSYYNYRTPCDQMESMGELEDYTVIVKKERPTGYIVADNTNPAIAEPVQFTAFVNQITDENVTGYKWTFNGGTPAQSTDRKPAEVTYVAEGVYDVTLELTLEGGVKKNITMYDFITVGEKAPEVNVDFTATPMEVFAGSAVDFSASATGTGSVTGYSWIFEGGTPATSTVATPAVSYATSGSYDVTLVATLNDGSQRTMKKSNYITVNPFLLRAAFTASSTKVNSGTDIVFTNTSIGAETYSWDFGDGSGAVTTENATHAFAAAGTYTVTLTVTGNGETQTKSVVIVVSAMKPADCMPTGSYTEWATIKKVQFGDISNDVDRTQFYHDFTGNAPFVMEKGRNVSYTLQAKNSNWPVGIYVWVDWNNDGHFDDATERVLAFRADQESDPATGTITVPAGAAEGVLRMRLATDYFNEDIANNPLLACGSPYAIEEYAVRIGAAGGDDELVMNIVADKPAVRENETVILSVEGAPEGAAYAWTFAGAKTTTSTEAQPVVSYAAAGAYDVQVVVTPQGGTAKTLQENRFIVVNLAKVSADFTTDKTLCAVSEEVNFASTSTATATIQSLEWTFEGGVPATSTMENPVVTYATPGKYDVTLKVTDEFGKTDTKVMPAFIEAREFIKADFMASAKAAAVGEPVSFTNRSVAAVNYTWTFDNGEPAVSTETNPTVSFKVKGAAMVTLVAEDADGNRSVKSEVLTITSKAFGAIQLDNLVQEYDGQVKSIDFTATPSELKNDIRVEYKQNGVEVTPKDAGIYDVTVSYAGTIPYSVEDVHAQLVIRKMPIQIVASNLRQNYTGETLKAEVTTVPAGYEDMVTVKYMQNGVEVAEPKNSGNYVLIAELEADNYMAEPLETEFAIRKIDGTVSIILEREYIFDGTPKYVAKVKTIPADLETRVTYNGSEEGAVEVGEHTVIATITDVNYEGVVWETMVIKPAAPEVKIQKDRFVYDGNHHDLEFTTVPENLDYEIIYRKDGEVTNTVVDGGIYEYAIQIIDENYDIVTTGEMEITKALAVVRISDLRFTYDGNTKTAAVETNPAGLAVDVTYNGFAQLPYAPGEYTVFAEIQDQNYRGYKTATMQIVRKGADMKIMDLVVSDGTHDCIFRIPELAGIKKSLVMYNQQGVVIYETKDYYDDFDMRDLPAGTYYYILKYVENGKPQAVKSFVEVIRK